MFEILDGTEVKQIINNIDEQKVNWGMKAIKADKAWDKYKGRGIKVGLLDTGIDAEHPDLKPNVVEKVSFIDDTDGEDANFHGTHVAGIFGAADTGKGVIGTAPAVEIYSAKVFHKDGYMTATAEREAIDWMIEKGVDVVNMSYGFLIGKKDSEEIEKAINNYEKLIQKLVDAGIIVVAATGNAGNTTDTFDRVSYPARFDNTIGVGAVSEEIERADFSSAGEAVDFAMPGVDIYSCYPGSRWARFSGTSMATPYLVGCIALLQEWAIEKNGKKFTLEEVKKYLLEYAKDLGVEGFDVEHGHGMVNIGKIGTRIVDKTIIEIDQPMTIINNRTVAPLRFIVEIAGGRILSWDNDTKTVVFETADGAHVTMQVDNNEVEVKS